jgi:hypothetical protein
MDFNQLSSFLSGQQIINLFFKTAAIVFSVMYLFYAIIIVRQTQVMNRTIVRHANSFTSLISTIQVFFALIALGLAILFL